MVGLIHCYSYVDVFLKYFYIYKNKKYLNLFIINLLLIFIIAIVLYQLLSGCICSNMQEEFVDRPVVKKRHRWRWWNRPFNSTM